MQNDVITAELNNEDSSQPRVRPHLGRIFFARLIDVILTSIPSFILAFFFHVNGWVDATIVTLIGFVLTFSYFVVIPTFIMGMTLGKLILRIKIEREEKNISFWALLVRETYYMFIPSLLLLIGQSTTVLVYYFMSKNANIEVEAIASTIQLIQNIGYLVYVCWYLYICLTIALQKNYQSAVDYKLKIFPALIVKKTTIIRQEAVKNNFHVHLEEDKPGLLDAEQILEDLNDQTEPKGE